MKEKEIVSEEEELENEQEETDLSEEEENPDYIYDPNEISEEDDDTDDFGESELDDIDDLENESRLVGHLSDKRKHKNGNANKDVKYGDRVVKKPKRDNKNRAKIEISYEEEPEIEREISKSLDF